MTSAPPSRTGSRSAVRPALALALLALVLRLLLLAAPGPDIAADWVYPEEQHRGNIAQEILHGPLLDLQDYHHAHNVGGSLVIGVLAVPFVALLGDTIFAVRLPTVLLHVAAVVLLFLIVDRWRGRRAAWLAGGLFTVATPGYTALSVTALGTHVENNTFVLGALLLFFALQERLTLEASGSMPRGAGSTVSALALGLVAGFACYFGYSFALVLLVILLLAFLRDRLFFVRAWFGLAVLGFAIGFLPWLRYALQHDFAALIVYDRTLDDPSSWADRGALLGKLGYLVATYLPASTFFHGTALDWPWAERCLAWTLVLLLALGAWRGLAHLARTHFGRRESVPGGLELACALQAVLFATAFTLTTITSTDLDLSQPNGGRYAAPLVPFLCIAFGLVLDARWDAPQPLRGVARALALGLPLVSLVGCLALVEWRSFGGGWRLPGSSPEELARWFAWRYKTDERRIARLVDGLERRDEDVRDGTIFVLAETLKSRLMIIPEGDPRHGAFRDACRRSLAFLREDVDERYRLYCQEPWPGERPYAWSQRDEFRREYAVRHPDVRSPR